MRIWRMRNIETPRIFILLQEAARLDAINKSLHAQLSHANLLQMTGDESELLIMQSARLQKAMDNTMQRIAKHVAAARKQSLTDEYCIEKHIQAAIQEIQEG